MRYRLIVWDFDGTLADTMPLLLATCNELAARHGLPPVADLAALRRLVTPAFLRQHGLSLLRLPRLVREYLTAIRGHMESVRLFAELPELLARLQAAGIRQGILSSNSEENIRACLRTNCVEHHFDFVTSCPRLFGKGRAMRRLLKQHRTEPAHFLYVGDEVRDVAAAQQAGVDVAAVAWGLHAREELARAMPTYLWTGPGEMWPVVGRE